MTFSMIGTSLIVTSDTRHCAPSAAAPSVDIRSTTSVGGSPGAMSADAGGGACASESVATVNESAPNRLAAARLPRMVLRISNPPCRFSVFIIVGQPAGQAKLRQRQARRRGAKGIATVVDSLDQSACGLCRRARWQGRLLRHVGVIDN